MSKTTKTKKTKKKLGRPYKLTYHDHVDMIRRYRAGEDALVLAIFFGVNPHTVWRYVKIDPAARHDAPKGAPPA